MSKRGPNKSFQTYSLSPKEHQFYWDNGYLVIKGLIDNDSLNSYRNRFLQVVSEMENNKCSNLLVLKESVLVKQGAKGENAINKLQDIHFDDVFMSYTEHPRMLHVLSQLVGNRLLAIHSMLINKPPGAYRHPPHQDLAYFPLRPADKIIASWTAMDPVTVDNGSLYVVPRSHKLNILYPHSTDSLRSVYHGISDESASEEGRVYLEMSPGDTVFFHPLLIHGSGSNSTKTYRKAISCHYASEECYYISEIKDAAQEVIFREVEEIARKRLGLDIAYIDIWKNKSKFIDVNGVCRNSKL